MYMDTVGITNQHEGLIDVRCFVDRDGKSVLVVDNYRNKTGLSVSFGGKQYAIAGDVISAIETSPDEDKKSVGAKLDDHEGSIAIPSPASVYWQANPVLSNETVMIAGAGLAGLQAKLCCGSATCLAGEESPEQPSFDVWEQSVKFVMPPACGPPCTVRIGTSSSSRSSSAVVVAINRPDVWWSTGASASVEGHFGRDVAVRAGQWLRVFGRSIAWNGDTCVSAAGPLMHAPSTTLVLAPGLPALEATNATCYEAWFLLQGVAAAPYPAARIHTAWGAAPLNVTIDPPLLPVAPTLIDVDSAHGEDLGAALLFAAKSAPAPRVVRLGARSYLLNATLQVPDHTRVEGAGTGHTILDFSLPLDANKLLTNGSVGTCGYPRPDGVTYEFCTPALSGGSFFQLTDLSLVIRQAPAGTSAVYISPGSRHIQITRINITLLQHNVSNAVRLGDVFDCDSTGDCRPIIVSPTANFKMVRDFEISHSSLGQYGSCQVANFQSGVVLYIQTASDGLFLNNSVYWRCGWEDIDVTDRLIVEANRVSCIEKGPLVGGNSASEYYYITHSSSRWWSYSRNHLSRPANNSPANWGFHETFTTDGSGW
jgi:hypothetical protein